MKRRNDRAIAVFRKIPVKIDYSETFRAQKSETMSKK